MSKKVKGMSIILGADASTAAAALGDIEKAGKSTARELGEVQKQLKFEPGNTELLTQKQALLTQQVANTADKLKILREAQEDVNKRFKEGEITATQHRDFQRELVKSESMLKNYEKQLAKVNFENVAFKQGLDKIAGAFDIAGKKMVSVGGTLAKSITAPILGVTAALTALVVKSSETGDRVDKLSQQVGLSRKAFQEWDYVLDQTGGNVESLKMGMSSLAQAAESDKDAFKKLGVEVDDVSGKLKSQEQLLYDVVRALQAEEDVTKRNALGKQLLGRSATELSVLLNSEAGELEVLTKRAHELGLVLDDDVIDKSAKTADMISDLKRSFSSATTELAAELMPAFIAFSNLIIEKVMPAIKNVTARFGELVTWFNNLDPVIKNVIAIFTSLVIAVGPVLTIIGKLTTGIGGIITAFGSLVAFIKTSLVPAILSINWPVALVVAAIAALATVAVEVYRAWEEVKSALSAIWEYLKAQAENMGIKISLSMQKMKLATIDAVDTILDKLSVLENLPWGLGEQFIGLKDKVGESVNATISKISELETAVRVNEERIGVALDSTKIAFGDLGAKISEDIELLISKIIGGRQATEDELEEVVKALEGHYDQVVDITFQKGEEINQERERFENQWERKLFQLTASRLEILEAEYKEALAMAEKYGADRTDVEAYYVIKRQEIYDAEAAAIEARLEQHNQAIKDKIKYLIEKRESIEKSWQDKLFDLTATELEKLVKAKDEAIQQAIDKGANIAAIEQYYLVLKQQIIDADIAKADKKREEENANLRRQIEKTLAMRRELESEASGLLFQLTATDLEKLDAEYERKKELYKQYGADIAQLTEGYLIQRNAMLDKQREVEEKRLAELDRIREEFNQSVKDKAAKAFEEREALETSWQDKLFNITATELERLERSKDKAIETAKSKGAETVAIEQYYAILIQDIHDAEIKAEKERLDKLDMIRQEHNEKIRKQTEEMVAKRERLEEEARSRLFDLKSSELEKLDAKHEAELEKYRKIGADITNLVEVYSLERQAILDAEAAIEKRRMDELEKKREQENEKILKQAHQLAADKATFEKTWSDKLFELTATPEMRLKRIASEEAELTEYAKKMGVSADAILGIQEDAARKRAKIEEEISEGSKTRWDKIMDNLEQPLDRLVDAISEGANRLKSISKAISAGNLADAFLTVLMETESFAKGLEVLGAALDPVVALFDSVLAPIINALLWVWNSIMQALSSINIFGWKPFGALKDKVIGPTGSDGRQDKRSRGTQIAEITGPTRDLLVDKLAPLANLPQIVAPLQGMYELLRIHLPIISGAGGGLNVAGGDGVTVTIHNLNVTSPTGSIQDIGQVSIRELQRELAKSIKGGLRGRGGR